MAGTDDGDREFVVEHVVDNPIVARADPPRGFLSD
jgi:hypothetical protein